MIHTNTTHTQLHNKCNQQPKQSIFQRIDICSFCYYSLSLFSLLFRIFVSVVSSICCVLQSSTDFLEKCLVIFTECDINATSSSDRTIQEKMNTKKINKNNKTVAFTSWWFQCRDAWSFTRIAALLVVFNFRLFNIIRSSTEMWCQKKTQNIATCYLKRVQQ